MKQKLIFDVTDANTIADSDSVGAYLRASDGTLLTHTDVGGKKALDVRVAEGINVEVDLDFNDDSVTAHQGGTWTIDSITNAVTVQATDLDIRDLDSATDSVTVVATQLDVDDLNATDDAVQAWAHDGTGNAIGSTAGALDVYVTGSDPLTINDAALANTAIATAANALDVANTAEDVVASPLASRKYLFIYNEGNRKIFVGPTGVTSANGFPLSPGAMLELRAGAAIDIEWVGPNTSQSIRTMELS